MDSMSDITERMKLRFRQAKLRVEIGLLSIREWKIRAELRYLNWKVETLDRLNLVHESREFVQDDGPEQPHNE